MTWEAHRAERASGTSPASVGCDARPTSPLAIAAVIVATFSVVCPPAGPIAVLLGILAVRSIKRRGWALRGRGLAATAAAVGSVTTLCGMLLIGWATGRLENPAPPRVEHASGAARFTLPGPIHAPALLEIPHAAPSAIKETKVGKLVVVDVGAQIRSLGETLSEQRTIALGAGQHMLVWLVVPDCQPCTAVEAALPDERMQRALSGARLVRINVVDFVVELSRLDVPVDAFPGFALLGPEGRPLDYVHGGEWDDDVPLNIAPVLESFVNGTYTKRRHPWRGGPHADETAI